MKKLNSVTKWTLILVVIATFIHLAAIPSLQNQAITYEAQKQEMQEKALTRNLNDFAYNKTFELYYQLKLKSDSSTTMSNLFIKDSTDLSDDDKKGFSTSILDNIERNVQSHSLNNSILYYAIDKDTEKTYYNTTDYLKTESSNKQVLEDTFSWYLIIDFNEDGIPSVSYETASDISSISIQTYYNAFNEIFSGTTQIKTVENKTVFEFDDKSYEFEPIKNATFRFAIEDTSYLSEYSIGSYGSFYPDSSMLELITCIGLFLIIGSLIVMFTHKKEMLLGFQTDENAKPIDAIIVVNDKTYPASLRNIPVEVMVMVDFIILGVCTGLGSLIDSIIPCLVVLFFLYLFAVYNVWYYMLILREKSLKKHSICVWIWRYFRKPAHKLYDFALQLDMSNQDTRRLIVIVSINFTILIFISIFYAFEIKFILLLLYSIGLYFLLKKYIGSINTDYHRLLNVIRNIATGKTNNHMDENLGLFELFKPELKDIQTNIETAIAEEVHSQQMKTELITNVSHDLKTPLTSLISYVDLLKKDDISQKDQKKYLDIIDKSSLRLKHLVEDLFEVSKANSGNVSLDLMKMDIVSLIKQVEVECDEALKKQKLTLRNTFSDDKIILSLDSQKTYRIFENLISNISKYALKGTRVYIDIKDYDTFVEISMKNISAQELNFDVEDITERFMRGDKSRNTEGSGLGLAIVKSFTEIQKGTLKIQMDGDLFKVFIRFFKNENEDKETKE